ncbi:NADH-quinone oxidoreductase subunit G [Myceligenerans cantabricum]
MTVTTSKPEGEVTGPKMVTLTIDGIESQVPEGTLIIRAAEQLGIEIPRFCDHPLLAPAGACRQCLVEVAMPDREGNVRPMPKPQASCTMTVMPGMIVKTQVTSPVADKAQQGVMELLLMNHPLDCPVCDKGGECPLQNQAMSHGRSDSRFEDVKRTFPKPVSLSSQILLDRERCVLCQRCTRFSDEIAGDAFIALQDRGAHQQIGRFDEKILGFESPGCGDGGCGCGDAEAAAPAGSDGRDSTATTAVTAAEADLRTGTLAGGETAAVRPGAETDVSGQGFSSYFSGNTVQICPVGALTGSSYRFRSRPFDLVSVASIAEHDSCGSAIRIDHRRGQVMRRLSGEDDVVNEEWITDKDRFAFTWQSASDRLTTPLVRDLDADGVPGDLRTASWAEALEIAAHGLAGARAAGGVGLLPGGRLTVEDAYAWSRFARQVLGTNDVDQRVRAHSDEEAGFLAHAVAGTGVGVTFADVEKAPAVLLVGLEAEEEAGVTFLRLRKGVAKRGTKVFGVAPYASRGLTKLSGTLLPAVPGAEAAQLVALRDVVVDGPPPTTAIGDATPSAAAALREEGAIILVGERLAASPGAYSAALSLARSAGARLAWIPRRAGERGGVEAGLLPNLLPGGRPVTDGTARAQVAEAWGLSSAAGAVTAAAQEGEAAEGDATAETAAGTPGSSRLPAEPGLDTHGIIDALSVGHLSGAVVGGVELADLPDPEHARKALAAAGFVVSLEVRRSEVTELADVVLPVAPPVERAGSYWNWEGRVRSFGAALDSTALPDHRALHALAARMGSDLGAGTPAEAHLAVAALGAWTGERADAPGTAATEDGASPAGDDGGTAPGSGGSRGRPAAGTAVLASWRMLLDDARGQDGERFLAGTAKRPVVRVSASTAAGLGLSDDGRAEVATDRGAVTLPVAVTAGMVDGVVWLPLASAGSRVHDTLGATPGDVVRVRHVETPADQGHRSPAAGDVATSPAGDEGAEDDGAGRLGKEER